MIEAAFRGPVPSAIGPSAILTAIAAAILLSATSTTTRQAGPLAHFHHLHLNSTDPAAAIDFYTSRFECERAQYAGREPAVWAQRSWLRFTKVDAPPPWELTSAVWHFGWGAEDMKAAYQKQLDMGTRFFTPLTDISDRRASLTSSMPMSTALTARSSS